MISTVDARRCCRTRKSTFSRVAFTSVVRSRALGGRAKLSKLSIVLPSRETWCRISPTTSAWRGEPARSSARSSSAPESPASGFLISWARPVASSPTAAKRSARTIRSR